MSEFTPGPWTAARADEFGDINITGPQDERVIAVAISNMRSPQEVAANAALLAASLDMLAALKDAEKRLRGAGMIGGPDDPVRAAIAKATDTKGT